MGKTKRPANQDINSRRKELLAEIMSVKNCDINVDD